jgi:MSHA biogenesis protein MshP
MCHKRFVKKAFEQGIRMRNASGFSLISAIFLLVVMAGLGAVMLTFTSVQQTTSTQDLQGTRAFQAARAGIDFGLYQVLAPSGTAVCGGAASPVWDGSLAGFQTTVNYACDVFTEGGNTITVFTITSTASAGAAGSPHRIERVLRATVSQ